MAADHPVAFALKLRKVFHTVSLNSALVLAGLLPHDLRVQETAALYKAKRRILAGSGIDYTPTSISIIRKGVNIKSTTTRIRPYLRDYCIILSNVILHV